jgi:hypothetical protein
VSAAPAAQDVADGAVEGALHDGRCLDRVAVGAGAVGGLQDARGEGLGRQVAAQEGLGIDLAGRVCGGVSWSWLAGVQRRRVEVGKRCGRMLSSQATTKESNQPPLLPPHTQTLLYEYAALNQLPPELDER